MFVLTLPGGSSVPELYRLVLFGRVGRFGPAKENAKQKAEKEAA